jgi:diguanylate cyclase (GGDEF)-like protein
MDEELIRRFKAIGTLPSPPQIARRILALAKNPDASVAEIAATLSNDPALTAKVLRLANSAFYAQRRRSQNLRQALATLGVDATLTLCLGFSIATSFRGAKPGAFDYTRYWRQAVLAGLAARCLGEALELGSGEDLFLAGLLQDIGVLALERVQPGFYAPLPATAAHAERTAFERERLGEDHAAVGAWLLSTWNLPEDLCRAVRRSHTPELTDEATEADRYARCVALGGELAATVLGGETGPDLSAFGHRALQMLALGPAQVGQVLERVTELAPELGALFDTAVLAPADALLLIDEARELLAARSLRLLGQVDLLKQESRRLAARSEALEDSSRRDGLTGVFNRRHLDERLAAEFAAAEKGGWDLAALFIDIDNFKRINDTRGHQAGDTVLRGTADLLKQMLRADDVLGRYGGEEFVVLLPGASRSDARALAERLLDTLRQYRHLSADQALVATASLGLAVHSRANPFPSGVALVSAADEAMNAAKRAGRNRLAERPAVPPHAHFVVA